MEALIIAIVVPATLALVIGGIAAGTTAIFVFRAYVFVQLWGWFAIPLGLPQVGTLAVAGLMLAYSAVTTKAAVGSKDATEKSWTELLTPFAEHMKLSLVLWGVGYAVHLLDGWT